MIDASSLANLASRIRESSPILVVGSEAEVVRELANQIEEAGGNVSKSTITDSVVAISQPIPEFIIAIATSNEDLEFKWVKSLRLESNQANMPVLILTDEKNIDADLKAIDAGADAFQTLAAFKYAIAPSLHFHLRIQQHRRNALTATLLARVQAHIGIYKHDFGNILAIAEGMLRRLSRTHPVINDDPSMTTTLNTLKRFSVTLGKLNSLRTVKDISQLTITNAQETEKEKKDG